MSQRWRLTIARGGGALGLQHRDVTPVWESLLARVAAAAGADAFRRGADEPGAPADERESGRPRVVFAAPLPTGLTASAELVDLVLPVGRLPRARLRAIVEPHLPADHVLLDAVDVWIGEQSLPSLVTAAAYTVDVAAPQGVGLDTIEAATEALLARRTVPRPGRDPARAPADLRPLIGSLVVEPYPVSDAGPAAIARLRMVLRIDPALGSGRPEEVVEALGRNGPALEIVGAHRDGFELRDPVKRQPRLTLGGPRPTLNRRTRTVSG
jgi:hypothetical protein